ncbi:MAG: right-handed parallel beta-helix repeat-containing protein [Prevotella sp.]|nr:right-handed parallel beta-helix repeat-containing protein [Prevotella sp.]
MKKLSILFLLTAVIMMASCSDDDTFTTSKSNLLTFTADTLRLDTTFSNVPTPTKDFWVYNHSGDGLRLTNVRLAQGNQTDFRVNVDGIELNAANGYQASNLEVRNKDSIRVFVEMTSPRNNGTEPEEITDYLIFTLESGMQQKVCLSVFSWDAQLLKGLEIKENTILTGTRPIVLQDTLRVDAGVTLTLPAGTTLYFSDKAAIDVHGTLHCEGTAEQPVTLRGDRLDWMFDYLPYDRISGQWQGIRFRKGSYGNILTHTDLHSAYNGIVCDADTTTSQKLILANSTVHNCQGYGLQATNCAIDAYNTQFSNTLMDCASFTGGKVTLTHCTLAQFYPFDSKRGAALSFGNHIGQREYPLQAFNVTNTLVTGYADDQLMGDNGKEMTANYQFDHCILRTSKPKDESLLAHFTDVTWENTKDHPDGGDKQFANVDADKQYYDLHLGKKSPAVNTGTSLTDSRFATDHDGKQRDATPDIGCFELADEEQTGSE